jgi:hypothetical protein
MCASRLPLQILLVVWVFDCMRHNFVRDFDSDKRRSAQLLRWQTLKSHAQTTQHPLPALQTHVPSSPQAPFPDGENACQINDLDSIRSVSCTVCAPYKGHPANSIAIVPLQITSRGSVGHLIC